MTLQRCKVCGRETASGKVGHPPKVCPDCKGLFICPKCGETRKKEKGKQICSECRDRRRVYTKKCTLCNGVFRHKLQKRQLCDDCSTRFKVCSKCGNILPHSRYRQKTGNYLNLQSQCKDCIDKSKRS